MVAHCLIGGLAFAQLQDDGQPCPPECVTDSMEIVTWYPSPYNEYEELRLYPTQRGVADCDDNKIGLMYYDDGGTFSFGDNDKIMVCKGALLGWQELSGYWQLSGNDIYNTNSGNVGIGTTEPQAKLEVAGQVKITGGTPAAGEVLTSDNAGLATWEPATGVPSGAVMFFNLTACPTGWIALAAAQGRYLVGLPSAGTLAGIAGTALTNLESRPVGGHAHEVTDPGHKHSNPRYPLVPGGYWSVALNSPRHDYPPLSSAARRALTDVATTGLTVNNTGVAGTNAPYLQLLVCSKE